MLCSIEVHCWLSCIIIGSSDFCRCIYLLHVDPPTRGSHYSSRFAIAVALRSIFTATVAAPKPLSTFTTLTPGAQLLNDVNIAAMPFPLMPYPTLVGTRDDWCVDEPGDDARQASIHSRDDEHDIAHTYRFDNSHESMQSGDADIVYLPHTFHAEDLCCAAGLARDSLICSSRTHDAESPSDTLRWRYQ